MLAWLPSITDWPAVHLEPIGDVTKVEVVLKYPLLHLHLLNHTLWHFLQLSFWSFENGDEGKTAAAKTLSNPFQICFSTWKASWQCRNGHDEIDFPLTQIWVFYCPPLTALDSDQFGLHPLPGMQLLNATIDKVNHATSHLNLCESNGLRSESSSSIHVFLNLPFVKMRTGFYHNLNSENATFRLYRVLKKCMFTLPYYSCHLEYVEVAKCFLDKLSDQDQQNCLLHLPLQHGFECHPTCPIGHE